MGEIRRALSVLIVVVWMAPSAPGPRFEPQCPAPAIFYTYCVRYA